MTMDYQNVTDLRGILDLYYFLFKELIIPFQSFLKFGRSLYKMVYIVLYTIANINLPRKTFTSMLFHKQNQTLNEDFNNQEWSVARG